MEATKTTDILKENTSDYPTEIANSIKARYIELFDEINPTQVSQIGH